MERKIDATTVRRQFGTLLDEVFHKGDVITIERKGKPLAQIIPVEGTPFQGSKPLLSSNPKDLLEELHRLPAISMEEEPTIMLHNLRKQKRVQANMKYGK